ncbi:MAG: ATP-grasp domain-containing protein [Bacilli bacterium]|nr:ATP-grasp domain-containing protein [Bacilli bacterium]
MNFVFISPEFPDSYYQFCKGLKKNGANVLGVGQTPYDWLNPDLKDSLTDYYKVDSLSSLEEKKAALSYFVNKYGKIDFIESNNEFYLEQDAALRDLFDVTTGPSLKHVQYFRHKSLMKEKYQEAGIKVAPFYLIQDREGALSFALKYGYPLCIKPDDGMGASGARKIRNEEELIDFLDHKDDHSYIMEIFVNGDLLSFDGVCDSKGDIVFPTSHQFPSSCMDVKAQEGDFIYYSEKTIPSDLKEAGQKILHAFGAKSRFYHLEFFRLNQDQEYLGKKGDLIGLEVNMRAPGGYTPDMINYAYSINIYQIWADVMCFDENREKKEYPSYYCAYVGRRYDATYLYSKEDIIKKYQDKIKLIRDNPHILADVMGDYFFMVNFDTKEEVNSFFRTCLLRK